MRRIKILIVAVLLMIGFSFNGELYMLYLNNFQGSYYQTNFYPALVSKEETNEDTIRNFMNAGEQYDVDFFVVGKKIKSAFETEITIYGTDEALRYLQSQDIKGGSNQSLFFGEATVRHEAFRNIKDVLKFDTYYFIGGETEKESFDAFKRVLISQYGGGFPKLIGSDRETWMNLSSVWGIILCLSLMMTLYEVMYQKKETMLRIILGENLHTIFVRNIVMDTGAFLILFLLIPRLLDSVTNVYFKQSYIDLLFALFLILNILLNAVILHVHFKKDLGEGHSGRGLLSSNYVMKVAATIQTIIILAGNVVVIRDAYNLYQQRDFFENHKNYSYYQSNYKVANRIGKTDMDDIVMNQQFYERFQSQSLQYADLTENSDSSYPVLLNNRTAMEEIKSVWPSIEKATKQAAEEKIYLLLPSSLSIDSREHDAAEQIASDFFDGTGYENVETIVYDKGISLPGIHKFNDYRMRLYKNPILIFNNTIFQTNERMTGYDLYYIYDIMYDISSKDWQNFIKEFQLEDQIISASNVLDVYEHSWSMVSRNMKLIIILSIFLLFMETTLILFIIRLEYQFNAVELALKKIHGYTLFQRNKKIIYITIYSSFVGMLAAYMISSELGMQGGYPLIIVGLSLFILELCFILRKVLLTEKSMTASILKGEKI